MTTPTPADLNEQNREFWRKRNLRIDALMENHDIAHIAANREIKKAAYVQLATNEVDRNERIRHQINGRQFEPVGPLKTQVAKL